MDDALAQKLLASIEADRLVILCGAGLSMALPSELPSAKELSEFCAEKYKEITGFEIPTEIRVDLEKLANYFWEQNLFKTFISLVPWAYFKKNPNAGHTTIADFLACGAIDFSVSTNFDVLIKLAAENLGAIDFYPSININEPTDPSLQHNPLIKIHGCLERDRLNTLWCSNQIETEPIKGRIAFYKQWLGGKLLDKDLLIIGYWTDWSYLNELLISCINQIEPNSVYLIDLLGSDELQDKAPDLWSWSHSGSIDFIHIKQSGDEFLNELRKTYSKQFLSRFFSIAKNAYEVQHGKDPDIQITIDENIEMSNLYDLRRDLTGTPINEIVRKKTADSDSYQTTGLCHLYLLKKGANFLIPLYEYKDKKIRVLHTPGQLLSHIKSRYLKEPPSPQVPELTICVGAHDDSSPPNIVRGKRKGNILRPGCSGEWITYENFIFEDSR